MAVEIPLTRGYVATVDAEDYERVRSAGSWHAIPNKTNVYAGRRKPLDGGRQTILTLHAFLTGWPLTDHRNGDGLDNRRSNLRQATVAQNNANARRRKDNRSGYKGVTAAGAKWRARIRYEGVLFNLGLYVTPQDAALAYDTAAIERFGEFARLNFPLATKEL